MIRKGMCITRPCQTGRGGGTISVLIFNLKYMSKAESFGHGEIEHAGYHINPEEKNTLRTDGTLEEAQALALMHDKLGGFTERHKKIEGEYKTMTTEQLKVLQEALQQELGSAEHILSWVRGEVDRRYDAEEAEKLSQEIKDKMQ